MRTPSLEHSDGDGTTCGGKTMKVMRPLNLASKPRVSVVIPCYNYGHFLPDAVDGVLEQAGVDVEVIIVDDASTDGSAGTARRIARRDPRVRVVAHEHNMGHIATYNDGLGQVSGDYVVLLSADDALAPGSLARSAALMEAHPDVVLVYGYAPSFETEIPLARTKVRSWSVWPGGQWINRICHRGTNIITNPEAMIRRKTMDALGGYDPSLPQAADMMLWMRAAALGNVGRINGPDQAFYRVHGGNMHLTDFSGAATELRERAKVFDTFFATDGSRLPNAGRMGTAARKALARGARRSVKVALHSGAPAAPALASLANELSSGLPRSGSRRNGAAVSRHAVDAGLIPGKLYLALDQLEWSLRWRIWRRYGL